MAHVSDIKLIRTDTTLDLSQKAEKGMLYLMLDFPIYSNKMMWKMVNIARFYNLCFTINMNSHKSHIGRQIPHWKTGTT
ncbi:hypothetical protein Pfo_024900, partial [Paulownia fortunei]